MNRYLYSLCMLGLLLGPMSYAQTLEPGVDGSITNLTPANVIVTSLNDAAGLAEKNVQVAAGKVFFIANDSTNSGEEIWITDGTTGGTMLLKDINPGSDGSDPKHLCAVGDTVYFSADNGSDGAELWMSDGSEAGTKMVKDIFLGGSNASAPAMLTPFKGGILFRAKDNISAADNDKSYLWWSDGTEAGTNQLHPIQPVEAPGVTNQPIIQVTGNGEKAFFVGLDDVAGQELWVTWGDSTKLVLDIGFEPDTNSTIAGRTVDTDIRHVLAVNDEQVWFRPFTPSFWLGDTLLEDSIQYLDNEVWVSDGNPWGTYCLRDINRNVDPNNPNQTGNSQASGPFNYDGHTYFRASDGIVNVEFHRTDLTPGGTELVKNINGQNNNGVDQPCWLELQTIFDGYLYFKGFTRFDDPAVGLPAVGQELSRYNATEDTVENVYDIFPGPTTNSQPRAMTVVNGRLYFRANDAPSSGNQELWCLKARAEDATQTPFKVVDLAQNGRPNCLVNFGEKLVFVSPELQQIYIYDDGLALNVYDPGNLARGPEVSDLTNPRIEAPAADTTGTNVTLHLQDYVKIYPNPAREVINIEIDHLGATRAGLYDLNGRLVWRGTLVQGLNQLPTDQFPNGIYTLFANVQGYVLPQKIIINR